MTPFVSPPSDLRNIFLDPRPLDKLFLTYTVMALPLPKQTEVFAVHRETTTGPIDVPPGGLPPLVTLSLAPNKYLVTAKLLVINVSSEPRQVSCTLRPMGAPGTPYDTSEVRLAPPSQAGPEMHTLVLHCVIELTAAGGVDVVCGHSGAVGDIRADYIWLTALSVSSVTKIEPS